MGNIIDVDVFSFNFIYSAPSTSAFWTKLTFFLIFTTILAMGCRYVFRLCFCRKRRHPINPITPSPPNITTILIIAIITIALITPIECVKKLKKKPSNKLSKFGKNFMTNAPHFLIPPLLYFGFDALAEFVQEEPELATYIFILFAFLTGFMIISLIEGILALIKFFKPARVSPSTNIEMAEMNRDPPRR